MKKKKIPLVYGIQEAKQKPPDWTADYLLRSVSDFYLETVDTLFWLFIL